MAGVTVKDLTLRLRPEHLAHGAIIGRFFF